MKLGGGGIAHFLNAKWLRVIDRDRIRLLDIPTEMKGKRLRCGTNWSTHSVTICIQQKMELASLDFSA